MPQHAAAQEIFPRDRTCLDGTVSPLVFVAPCSRSIGEAAGMDITVTELFWWGRGWGSEGPEMKDEITITKLLCPFHGKVLALKPPNFFFLRAQKWSKTSKKFSFKKCHKAHQIDQRSVLYAKMYVVGAKNHSFFQGSKVVKIGQNSPAEFRHHHSVIDRGGGGGTISIPGKRVAPCIFFDVCGFPDPVVLLHDCMAKFSATRAASEFRVPYFHACQSSFSRIRT